MNTVLFMHPKGTKYCSSTKHNIVQNINVNNLPGSVVQWLGFGAGE